MSFEQFENTIEGLISLNKLDDAIRLLREFFRGDSDLDDIIIQSAKYHSIVDRQIKGLTNFKEVDIELNNLRSNILDLLRAKKEYLKYKELTFGKPSLLNEGEPDKIKVFFSVGSPYNDNQQNYINTLVDFFYQTGIILETLKGWNDNDPLVPILDEMKESSGCLVLALERLHVLKGVEKRGSEQEDELINASITSPWLHIETALARSLDLPLIILKDKSLKNEGLIHDNKQEWGIVRIDQDNIGQIREYPVKNFILNWVNQVKKYHANKSK